MTEIRQKIVDYLNDYPDDLLESGIYVKLSLVMVGKRAQRTKPMVMMVSNDKRARTRLVRQVRDSKIMDEYPDFGLSDMDLPKEYHSLRPLGRSMGTWSSLHEADRTEIFISSRDNRLMWNDGRMWHSATAGGVIMYRGRKLLHTVHHLINDAQPVVATATAVHDLGDSQEMDLTDMTDIILDSGTSDERDEVVDITSRGSISGSSDVSLGDDSSTPAHTAYWPSINRDSSSTGHDSFGQLQSRDIEGGSEGEDMAKHPAKLGKHATRDPQHVEGNQLANQSTMNLEAAPLGKAIMACPDFDSLIVDLEFPFRFHPKDSEPLPLEEYHYHIHNEPRNAEVNVVTASGTVISGKLLGSPSYMRLPHTNRFQEVFTAQLSPPLVTGDSGCWVRDKRSNGLYGHVVAGSPETGLVIIVPARSILPELMATMMRMMSGDVADIKVPDYLDPTCLHHAVRVGDKETVESLLKRGADIEATVREGDTPLLAALELSRKDKLDIVIFLLDHGADVNKANQTGFTPLMMAVWKGDTEAINLLLDHGADINKVDWAKMSPLMMAIRWRKPGLVRVLLDHGAHVNFLELYDQQTPLGAAFMSGDGEAMGLLLDKYVDDGHHPSEDFQASNGYSDLERLISDTRASRELSSTSGASTSKQPVGELIPSLLP